MDITSLLKKLKRWAAAQPDVVGVALIGAYARGSANEESDVDVIILTTKLEYFRTNSGVAVPASQKPEEHWGESRLCAFLTDRTK
jgi:predicted nucleotidyltransferase